MYVVHGMFNMRTGTLPAVPDPFFLALPQTLAVAHLLTTWKQMSILLRFLSPAFNLRQTLDFSLPGSPGQTSRL